MKFGYDEKICPLCGTRLVNRRCPACGAMRGFTKKQDHSKYGKYEPMLRVLNYLMGILCVLSLLGCAVTYIANNKAEHPYEIVQATVTKCEQKSSLFSYNSPRFTVTVLYNGEQHELHNVTQGRWYYPVGSSIEVYLANHALYANEAGVRSTGVLANLYFVCLFGFMGLLTGTFILRGFRKEIQMRIR